MTMRQSIRATYDSRKTGPAYWVTTAVNDRVVNFQQRIPDPFGRTTVTICVLDAIRGLFRRKGLTVEVAVGGLPEVMNDVLELDENPLIPGRSRQQAWKSHITEAIGRFESEG